MTRPQYTNTVAAACAHRMRTAVAPRRWSWSRGGWRGPPARATTDCCMAQVRYRPASAAWNHASQAGVVAPWRRKLASAAALQPGGGIASSQPVYSTGHAPRLSRADVFSPGGRITPSDVFTRQGLEPSTPHSDPTAVPPLRIMAQQHHQAPPPSTHQL